MNWCWNYIFIYNKMWLTVKYDEDYNLHVHGKVNEALMNQDKYHNEVSDLGISMKY